MTPPSSRERIGRSAAVHVSPVTLAELLIKSMIGKVEIPENLHRRVLDQSLIELPLTLDQMAAIDEFPELARRPFDRMLVAQAKQAGLEFITADRTLLSSGRTFIVDATQ